MPAGCVGLHKISATYTTNKEFLDKPLVVDGNEHFTFHLSRHGFRAALAYAFTDHFCQGASFQKGKPWLAHMTPPPNSPMSGEGILVTCTRRFQQWRDLVLLAPIYKPGDAQARARAIQRFANALARKPDAEAEMARVEALCQQTHALHWERLHAQHGLEPIPPTPPEQPLDLSKKAAHKPHTKRGRR